jgi:hypothetical protein
MAHLGSSSKLSVGFFYSEYMQGTRWGRQAHYMCSTPILDMGNNVLAI